MSTVAQNFLGAGSKVWAGSLWDNGSAGGNKATGLTHDFKTGTLPQGAVFLRATDGSYFDSAGKLQFASTNVPRYDYDPVTKQPLGLLIEDQSTNLVKRSFNPVGGAWVASGDVKAVVSYVGDSVALTAAGFPVMSSVFKIDNTAGTAWAYITCNDTAPNNSVATASVWVRAAIAGSVGKKAMVSANYANNETNYTLTDKYVRVAHTVNVANFGRISVGVEAGCVAFFALPQYEVASLATSYIKTLGTAVTRNGDILSMPINSWFSQAAGTVYAEFDRLAGSSGSTSSQTIVDLATDTNSRMQVRVLAGDLAHVYVAKNGAGSWDSGFVGAPVAPNKTKIGFGYGGGTATLVCNGVLLRDETVDTPPVTDWYIGRAQWGGEYLNGHISSLAFVASRETDAVMTTKTT